MIKVYSILYVDRGELSFWNIQTRVWVQEKTITINICNNKNNYGKHEEWHMKWNSEISEWKTSKKSEA